MHVAKYTAAAAGGLVRHYERQPDPFGGMMTPNKKNQNIDWDKTGQNYSLGPPGRGVGYIRERCGQVRCLKRSDVNVMCDWVVTIPQKILQEHPEQERQFFEFSYKYLSDKYGAENVVSACVHLDETTPHMHFAWVPVVRDKNRGDYKVSAKECVTRADMCRIHDDMSRYLSREMGIDVKLRTGGTISKELTVDQLKDKKLKELQDLQSQVQDLREQKNKLTGDLWITRDELDDVMKQLTVKKTELKSLENDVKEARLSMLWAVEQTVTINDAIDRFNESPDGQMLKQFRRREVEKIEPKLIPAPEHRGHSR